MRAYISISIDKRATMHAEVTAISKVLISCRLEAFIFVDNYTFNSTQEKEMMEKAFKGIDESDLLIAETSEKAIGIGVEVGYAKAKKKPVIYLRHITASHSTTVAGTSNYQVIYSNTIDLEQQLKAILLKIDVGS